LQESLKKLGLSKDGTIESMRIEKARFAAQLEEQKEEMQSLQKELEQVRRQKS
jgi:hypothetical protein